MLIIQFGTALMAPTGLAVASLAALILGCQLQVRLVEEPYLLTTHPISYPNYATRAGRFVPLLDRLHHADNAREIPASSHGGPRGQASG